MHRLFALPLLALLLLFPATSSASPATVQMRPAFTWGASATTDVPWLSNVDIRPMIVTAGATFNIIYSSGDNAVHRWSCTSMDSCTAQPNGILDGSFPTANGAKVWLGGGILSGPINGGTYYATVHVEQSYNSTNAPTFNWFRKIGLAKSTDNGLHWAYIGDIITSDMSYDIGDFSGAPAFQAGPGDEAFFASWNTGYAYISFTTYWADVNTGARTEQTNIARCPLASIAQPSCWRKFNKGNWNQPGIGGHNTAIFAGEDNASISWDSYLNEFIAVGHSTSYASFISTATDLTQENWTPPQHFVDDSLLNGWYLFIVGLNADPFTVGSQMRIYSADNGTHPTHYFILTLANT